MTNMTLAVPEDLHEIMRKHNEIKWSEIARKGIIDKIVSLRDVMKSKDIFNLLSFETQKDIKEVPKKEWVEFYKNLEEKEWKRKKFLTQA